MVIHTMKTKLFQETPKKDQVFQQYNLTVNSDQTSFVGSNSNLNDGEGQIGID